MTPPPLVNAQVWLMPAAAISLTPLVRPETSTGTRLSVGLSLPSSPAKFDPQHLTPPALVSAQVCL